MMRRLKSQQRDLNYSDFKNILDDLKNFTSPGENKIPTEIFQALPETQKKQFFDFLNLCWKTKWTPERWKQNLQQNFDQ